MTDIPIDFFDRDLQPDERRAIRELDHELARVQHFSDRFIFVLGSYHPVRKKRLIDIADALSQQCPGNIHAMLMDQFLEKSEYEVMGHMKFRTIARRADAIVGVVEKDEGGFTYEQGIIMDNPEIFSKTFVLKKRYKPAVIEHRQYNWMQATSPFEELRRVGRLYEWTADSTYNEIRNELIEDITNFLY